MSSVVLDPEALAQLRQADGLVEIRDQAGQLVGYFTPPREHAPKVSSYRDVNVPFTDEDLDRFESEPGGRALDQILKEFGSKILWA
jgi:hypothetical protein